MSWGQLKTRFAHRAVDACVIVTTSATRRTRSVQVGHVEVHRAVSYTENSVIIGCSKGDHIILLRIELVRFKCIIRHLFLSQNITRMFF